MQKGILVVAGTCYMYISGINKLYILCFEIPHKYNALRQKSLKRNCITTNRNFELYPFYPTLILHIKNRCPYLFCPMSQDFVALGCVKLGFPSILPVKHVQHLKHIHFLLKRRDTRLPWLVQLECQISQTQMLYSTLGGL